MGYLFCSLDTMVVLAFVTALMWFKIFIQNVVGPANRHVAAEDKKVPGADVPEVTDGGHQKPDEEFTRKMRVGNINNNDKENVPYTLFVFWATYIVCTSGITTDARPSMDVLFLCALLWLVARVSHTLCYLFALQPFRSISWAVGQLAALACCITLVIAAFQVRFSDEGDAYCELEMA